MCCDITSDPLPRADVILCRDCLVHFSLADAQAAIGNFARSGSAHAGAGCWTGTADQWLARPWTARYTPRAEV